MTCDICDGTGTLDASAAHVLYGTRSNAVCCPKCFVRLMEYARQIVDMPENINRVDTRIVQARELLDTLQGMSK